MDLIDFIKVVGAFAAVIGTCYSISNSKRTLLRRIDRKQSRIDRIDRLLDQKYGFNRGNGGYLDPLDQKKERLQNEINELRRYL